MKKHRTQVWFASDELTTNVGQEDHVKKEALIYMIQTVCYLFSVIFVLLSFTVVLPFLRKFSRSFSAHLFAVGIVLLSGSTIFLVVIAVRERLPCLWIVLVGLGTFLVAVSGSNCCTDLLHLSESYRSIALRDPLTGILNRRGFVEAVRLELSRTWRNLQPFTIAFFDIDNFKDINDTYGHPHGDKLLQFVGQVCMKTFRKSDCVARIGGDEFCVLFPQTTKEEATHIVDRFCDVLKALTAQQGVTIELSAGLASFPEDGQDLPTLLHRADEIMYASKRQSRRHDLEEKPPTAQTN